KNEELFRESRSRIPSWCDSRRSGVLMSSTTIHKLRVIRLCKAKLAQIKKQKDGYKRKFVVQNLRNKIAFWKCFSRFFGCKKPTRKDALVDYYSSTIPWLYSK